MRALKLNLPWPPGLTGTLQVRPADQRYVASSAGDIAADRHGQIVPVYVELAARGAEAPHVSFRRLELLRDGLAATWTEVQEEIGESIARHAWDAGIVTVSLIAEWQLHIETAAEDRGGPMAWLKDIATKGRKPCVLELGCGVGILGIGIASTLELSSDRGPGASVLMTDLPDAKECAVANIARHMASCRGPDGPTVDIQYEDLDWEDGKRGQFGPSVRSRAWDLIVLSDCTYNVDVLPTLVQTLSELHSASLRHPDRPNVDWETRVLLATKPRHPSEEALFDLMSASGWSIHDKAVHALPVLDAEDQTVEVYLFAKQ